MFGDTGNAASKAASEKTIWFVQMVREERAKARAAGELIGPPPTAAELTALASWALRKEAEQTRTGLGATVGAAAAGLTTGATAGAAAGPWGAAIGGAVGLVGSLFGKADKSAQIAKQVASRQLAAAQAQGKAQVEAARLTVEAETVKAQAKTSWMKYGLIGGAVLLLGGGALAFFVLRRKKG